MLVLTRKSNQSIMIGDDVEISVLSVMGEKVRIGIQAPQEIPVFRTEIYLEIQRKDGEGHLRRGRPGGDAARLAREVDDALTRARRAPAQPLAQQQVQRAEHHHGDDRRGPDEREHQQGEAHRAAFVTALAPRV